LKEENRTEQRQNVDSKASSTVKHCDQDPIQAASTCKQTPAKKTTGRSRSNMANQKEEPGKSRIKEISEDRELAKRFMSARNYNIYQSKQVGAVGGWGGMCKCIRPSIANSKR
jgi:hypothetical protein